MPEPRWLAHNPWRALQAEAFTWETSRGTESRRLEVVEAGVFNLPSGQLLANSLILGLTVDEPHNGGYLEVPSGPYAIRLTVEHGCAGQSVLAYVSLVRSDEPEAERKLLQLVGGEQNSQSGIVQISKYVFALCDRGDFNAAFRGDWERYQFWLESTEEVPKLKAHRLPLPKRLLRKGGEVVAFSLLNPLAAPVGGYDSGGDLVAVHFSFLTHANWGSDLDAALVASEADADFLEAIRRKLVPITGSMLERVGRLTELEALTSSRVCDSDLAHLASLQQLHSLNLLSSPELTQAGLAELAGLSSLRTLDLRGLTPSPEGLAGVGKLTQLKTLILPAEVTDAHLADLATLTGLQELVVTGAAELVGSGLAALGGLTELRILKLPRSGLGDPAAAHLTAFAQLECLDLSQTHLTGNALGPICLLTSLRELDLAQTQLNDSAQLLGRLAQLEALNLEGTGVTDQTLPSLGELESLRSLNLRGTGATVEGATALGSRIPACEVTLADGASLASRLRQLDTKACPSCGGPMKVEVNGTCIRCLKLA